MSHWYIYSSSVNFVYTYLDYIGAVRGRYKVEWKVVVPCKLEAPLCHLVVHCMETTLLLSTMTPAQSPNLTIYLVGHQYAWYLWPVLPHLLVPVRQVLVRNLPGDVKHLHTTQIQHREEYFR